VSASSSSSSSSQQTDVEQDNMDLEIKEAMVAVVAGVPFGRQSLGTPSSDDAPQNAALNSD